MKRFPISRRYNIHLIILLLPLLTFTSCSRKKFLPKSNTIIPNEIIVKNFLHPTTVQQYSAKMKIRVSNIEDAQKATLFVRAKKDSLIWMAVKRLSVEGARVLITPDSIFMIDRLNKSYQIVPLAEIQSKYGLKPDFSYLYDMLLGIPPEVDSSRHWQISQTVNQLSIETLIEGMLNKFVIDRYSGKVVSGRFMDSRNISGSYQYENYQILTDSISLPIIRNYEVHLPEGQKVNATLELSDIELNVENSINFSIPEHYTRLE